MSQPPDNQIETPACPFCGGKDLGIVTETEDREGFPTSVYCATCGARGPWIYTTEILTSLERACQSTGWNMRATP
jgi:Lar family restriction alleviation protein